MSAPLDLLIVDDDEAFTHVLSRAMQRRGVSVHCAHNTTDALAALQQFQPARILLDLKLAEESGLSLLRPLREHCPDTPIVILTGYSSVATAVEAVKLGATHYLCKPASVEEILAAFGQVEGNPGVAVPEHPPSVDRMEWEHIQRVLAEHDGNISATARALGMHRRTLQRKLQKRPVRR